MTNISPMFSDDAITLMTKRQDALEANLAEFQGELAKRGLDNSGSEYVAFAKEFADRKIASAA